MKNLSLAIVLFLQTLTVFSQTFPTVTLSVSKPTIQEINNRTTYITATLSAAQSYPVILYLQASGTASFNTDYISTEGASKHKVIAGGSGTGAGSAQFNNPYGIFVDAAGNLFVADRSNHRIQKWAPGATSGTTVAGGNGQGAAANQLNFPSGVFVTTNGDIYIADSYNNRIQKWTPGATTGVTVAGGNGQGAGANQLSNPSAVFIDTNGDIYICDQNNYRVQKWTPGASSGTTVAGGYGPGTDPDQLNLPSDIFVDANGNLFVCDSQNNRIQKWAPGATTGTTVAGGNGAGSGANQLNKPNGVFVDTNGNIYITDYQNNRIQKWASGASSGTTVGGNSGGYSPVNSVSPVRITGDSNGKIYFSDLAISRIQRLSTSSETYYALYIYSGQTSGYIDITAQTDNLDEEPDETIILTPESIHVNVSSTPPANITILNEPVTDKPRALLSAPVVEEENGAADLTITLDKVYSAPVTVNLGTSGDAIKGTDYTLSAESVTIPAGSTVATVQIIPINDNIVEPLESIIISVTSGTNVAVPYLSFTTYLSSEDKPNLILSSNVNTMSEVNGNITVTVSLAEPTSRDVTVDLFPSGAATYKKDYTVTFPAKMRTVAGSSAQFNPGASAGLLNNPIGISVDAAKNVYVADSSNHRIQKWAFGATRGITVAGGNGKGSAANQLHAPAGVFVTPNGDIYVADSYNHRVQKWTPGATSGITVAGGNGKGNASNQLNFPTAVFVTPNGDMYIADQNNHRIQKWTPGAIKGIIMAGGNGLGTNNNQLNFPSDVYVDDTLNIYIADQFNNRIQKWAPGSITGIPVAGNNGNGSFPSMVYKPNGIFIEKNGDIYVADTYNNRLQKFTPGVVDGVSIAVGLGMPARITGDADGNIYFSEQSTTKVQRINYFPSIVIPAGQTQVSQTIVLTGIDDSENESDESIILTPLAINAETSSTSPLNLTITSDDPLPTISLSAPIVEEEKPSTDLKIALNRITDKPVTVNLSFSGIAIKGTDYTLSAESITIQPGDSIGTIQIIPINDNMIETLESIIISVSSAINASLPYPTFTTYLSSEDKPTVDITSTKSIMTENDVTTIRATLSEPTSRETVINLGMTGTAKNYIDYVINFPLKEPVLLASIYNGTGLALDANDNIFVAESNNHRVLKLTPDASSRTTIGWGAGTGSVEFFSPKGIFVDKAGYLYVADKGNNRIQKWNPSTIPGTTVVSGLNSPEAVFIDTIGTGNFYIADANNHRIYKKGPSAVNGIIVAGGNGQGNAANQLNYPTDVFVDKQENMYIVDRNNHRVQKWEPGATSGITVAGGNGAGNAANQLNNPYGVYVDDNKYIYVADYGNNRIQVWVEGATKGVTITNISTPLRLAPDKNKRLLVTNEYQLKRFIPQSQIVIPAGSTSFEVTLSSLLDTEAEGNETITLNFLDAANATPTTNSLSITISDVAPDQPGPFTTSSTNVCKGQNNVIYTVPPVNNTTGYIWTYSGTGANFISTTNTVSVSFNNTATSGTLSVKAQNSTGTSPARTINITVGEAPAQPGAFTTSTQTICGAQNNVVYTVPAVAEATSYTWTYSGTGASFSSTTNSVNINFNVSATSGILSVKANNTCGSSAERTINIMVGVPPQPSAFSASTQYVCSGQTNVVYTATPVTGATNYTWAYSGTGATFSSTTNTVSVNYDPSATSGILSVKAGNTCGLSNPLNLNVSIVPTSTPQNIVLNGPLTINNQVSHIAQKSVTLTPTTLNPISINQGAVFLAAIAACPN
jgi:sugar lactone lactonase YvrE